MNRRLTVLAALLAALAMGCASEPNKRQTQWRYLEHELEDFPRLQDSLSWRPMYDRMVDNGMSPKRARKNLRRAARFGPFRDDLAVLVEKHGDPNALQEALDLAHAQALDARYQAGSTLGYPHPRPEYRKPVSEQQLPPADTAPTTAPAEPTTPVEPTPTPPPVAPTTPPPPPPEYPPSELPPETPPVEQPLPPEPPPAEPEPLPPVEEPTEPLPPVEEPSEPLPPMEEPAPSEPAPSEPLPDEPLPDEPMPSEPLPDEPLPDEPLPDEPLPDEPLPDDGN